MASVTAVELCLPVDTSTKILQHKKRGLFGTVHFKLAYFAADNFPRVQLNTDIHSDIQPGGSNHVYI